MNFIKKTAVRAAALLLFFIIIVAIILYQAGVYDISFIDRPRSEVTTGDKGTNSPDSETGSQTNGNETPEDETSSPPATTVDDKTADELLALIKSLGEMESGGWRVTTAKFDPLNHSVARLDFNYGTISDVFSGRNETVTKVSMVKNSNGLYSEVSTKETFKSPSVKLYYGLIILDDGKNINIYNAAGKRLVKNFTGTFVNARTADGFAVVKVKNKFYYINPESGLSGEIKENKIEYLALNFDSPVYYAAKGTVDLYPFSALVEVLTEITTEKPTTPKDTETSPPDTTPEASNPPDTPPVTDTSSESDSESSDPPTTESTTGEPGSTPEESAKIPLETEAKLAAAAKKVTDSDGKTYSVENVLMWGYKNGAGEVVIEAQYRLAYGFTKDNLAAVVDFEGNLFFIDSAGTEKVTLRKNPVIRPAELNKLEINQYYYTALADSADSLGMYYYDNGYVMARYVWRGTVYASRMYKNDFVLIDTNGKSFDIPGGYTLNNYSDGTLLLSKNDMYGYMDLTGGWIEPPIFTDAHPFIQGLAVVGNSDGKYGLIDTDGNMVLPLYFDYISDASSGYVATFKEARGWEIYCVVEK